MEQITNYLFENPLIIAILGGILFVVTLVAVVRRLFSFVMTLALLILCLISAFTAIYPKEAMTWFQDLLSKEEIQNTVDTLNKKYEEIKESVKEQTKPEEVPQTPAP
jgi:hypothetical protein